MVIDDVAIGFDSRIATATFDPKHIVMPQPAPTIIQTAILVVTVITQCSVYN
jgi:hypothetical protein